MQPDIPQASPGCPDEHDDHDKPERLAEDDLAETLIQPQNKCVDPLEEEGDGQKHEARQDGFF
jgi:hypothetical protein